MSMLVLVLALAVPARVTKMPSLLYTQNVMVLIVDFTSDWNIYAG